MRSLRSVGDSVSQSRLATDMKHLVSMVSNLELEFQDGSYRCNK